MRRLLSRADVPGDRDGAEESSRSGNRAGIQTNLILIEGFNDFGTGVRTLLDHSSLRARLTRDGVQLKGSERGCIVVQLLIISILSDTHLIVCCFTEFQLIYRGFLRAVLPNVCIQNLRTMEMLHV